MAAVAEPNNISKLEEKLEELYNNAYSKAEELNQSPAQADELIEKIIEKNQSIFKFVRSISDSLKQMYTSHQNKKNIKNSTHELQQLAFTTSPETVPFQELDRYINGKNYEGEEKEVILCYIKKKKKDILQKTSHNNFNFLYIIVYIFDVFIKNNISEKLSCSISGGKSCRRRRKTNKKKTRKAKKKTHKKKRKGNKKRKTRTRTRRRKH